MFIRILIVMFAVVASTGCARNAILEGELLFPPAPGLFAVVQVFDGDTPFGANWEGNEISVGELGVNPIRYPFSVNVEDEEFSGNLHVKIGFCTTNNCGAFGDPVSEVWYPIESPIYQGQVTRFTREINGLPHVDESPPTGCVEVSRDNPGSTGACVAGIMNTDVAWCCEIDRCQVAGCVDGMLTMYCEDGVHFCEQD